MGPQTVPRLCQRVDTASTADTAVARVDLCRLQTAKQIPKFTKDPRGNKLPFLAVRRKPSGAAKPEGLRPTASFNPVIYFRAAP